MFQGEVAQGLEYVVFATCSKPRLRETLYAAREIDPEVVYSVEPVSETGPVLRLPLPHPTAWR